METVEVVEMLEGVVVGTRLEATARAAAREELWAAQGVRSRPYAQCRLG